MGKFVKINNFKTKKGYIEENTNLTMNLKERGITVGDLLIILIIILTSLIVIKNFNKDNKETLNTINHEIKLDKKNLLSKNFLIT